jgi:hypothetical protein
VSDLVTCAECGSHYDSERDAFCPRCGSTAKGKILPAALAVARRNDPGRRRVQVSGVVLLIIGLLFLGSTVAEAVLSKGQLPGEYADLMADQAGGTLVVDANGTAFMVTVLTMEGRELANRSSSGEPVEIEVAKHAGVRLQLQVGNATTNATAVVLPGDRLEVDASTVREGQALSGSSLQVIGKVAIGFGMFFALLLAGGGLAALRLRWFPLAATAAILGALVGVFALFFFLTAGLLFAVPFGFAAYFVLRGKRHFAAKDK